MSAVTPRIPSCREVQEILASAAATTDAMANLLRATIQAGKSSSRRTLAGSPKCILVIPVLKATSENFSTIAAQPTREVHTCIALLRWTNGFAATLQLSCLAERLTPEAFSWVPRTMTVNSTTRMLSTWSRKEHRDAHPRFVEIAHLRLQTFIVQPEENTFVQIVQPGITRFRKGARFRSATLSGSLDTEETRIQAAHDRRRKLVGAANDRG